MCEDPVTDLPETSTEEMSDDLAGVLDSVQTSILIVDSSCRIIYANKAVCRLTGRSWSPSESDSSCFAFLFKKKSPCSQCPLSGAEQSAKVDQAVTIPSEHGESIYARKLLAPWGKYTVVTLLDITREVTLLRSLDLSHKEQQAKNVLLDRKRKEVLREQQFLRTILDYLPESVVTVQGSFEIERKNKSLADIFPGRDSQCCYELLGKREPCEGCPALEGFAGLNDIRKSHLIGDRYITESITASPFGTGGILVFRETTRQIKLIEQIRLQRETIIRKSQIMSSLADLGAMMQKEPDQNEVIEFFWEVFFNLVKVRKAILLVNDIRAGTIWFASHRGASSDEIRDLSRKYLARDIQNQQQNTINLELEACHETKALFLQGRAGALVGLLLIGGWFDDQEEMELIDLFTEPLAAYLQNCLLSRKLEEKANTDPLTGLYNRGYLERALAYEQKKLSELGINYAVVVADINLLKKANDLYGHEAGDRLIVKVSELLGNEVRSTDILARTGGDEFVILLPEALDDSAFSFVRRMEDVVFDGQFILVGEEEQFPVTVSFGSAGSDRYPAVEELLREADRLMYQAKEHFYQKSERYR